jgi:hypothetical protein
MRADIVKRYPFKLVGGVLLGLLLLFTSPTLSGQERKRSIEAGPAVSLSQILGRPTDRSITLSVLSAEGGDAYVEWRRGQAEQARKTATMSVRAGVPAEIALDGLHPDTQYFYQLFMKVPSQASFQPGAECSFHTQRSPGSTFTFALQGDSHPERAGKMYDPRLYVRTLHNVSKDRPDFYLTLGDDFSIERLIEQQALSQDAVDQVYAHQRGFLGIVGSLSPLYLVNGNHEQAARYLLDGTETNAAVLAARARARFYPLPAPDRFYTGDAEQVEHIGLLRDYYAWTWGDALFVVIDPYWHSPVAVDTRAGKRDRREGNKGGRKDGKEKRDLWQATLGEVQYRWLFRTLTESRSHWKFVFAHHVNGTGRGGVEMADQFEWGAKDRRRQDLFQEKRPGWTLPVHELMAKTGVTIFFQGHDHLYARQDLDAVVYQSVPNPADPTYREFNREAYRSGDIHPNSGHVRVTVSPGEVRVDYVRAFLPSDEGEGRTNGMVGHTYTIRNKRPGGGGT